MRRSRRSQSPAMQEQNKIADATAEREACGSHATSTKPITVASSVRDARRNAAPWYSVGSLKLSVGSVGTAPLIGPDGYLLTASPLLGSVPSSGAVVGRRD